ncbi:MAG: S-layer homology domain-containing protein [Clostridia bacterium]|jgi:spore germination protein YaaH|nr:S-layer homology domain-containing protein [Clostridia bacterium]
MKFKKIFIVLIIAISMCSDAFAAQFSDVSENHWAYGEINKASEYGFITGMGDGTFGLGKNVTRAQFASMVVRMFGFKENIPDLKYSDVGSKKWYYSDVETALANGVSQYGDGCFRPDDNITREEMAVMLIRALGYDSLALQENSTPTPFTDVSENMGYINLAYNFGIISGKSSTEFNPKGTATREEAAAMMVRCYEKHTSKINFLHGFYAFSSYSQKDIAADMNAVSFGWSRLEEDNGTVVLSTLHTNGNEWAVPDGYEDIVKYLKEKNIKTNLNVYMSAGEGDTAADILSDSQKRSAAVDAIMDELTASYKNLGYNPYSGVTIDFENLRSSQKSNFVSFLKELKEKLNSDKTLYVAVQPPMKNGSYFDGYDFKKIGNIADKVILMAYDYNPKSISQDVMESGFTTTPVSPFDEVYFGLKAVTDSKTGVQDKSKIVLGMSFNNVGWTVDNGKITNSKGITYTYADIEKMIQNGANVKYSDKYRNPYLVYSENGQNTIVWFENAESIKDKCELAKMFGINGISFWRLGMIPNGSGNFDVWNTINNLR